MNRFLYSLLIVVFIQFIVSAQTVTGKLLDHNGSGLSGLTLQLFVNTSSYNATSGADGSFTFNNIALGIDEKDELPSGYAISNNYPNPFNPKTRIGFNLAKEGMVKINIYNMLGQSVIEEIERHYSSGISYIDLELQGLPNGRYLARIAIDGKYTVTRKLMLIYGSNHLSAAAGIPDFKLNKSSGKNSIASATILDSLVVTSDIIGRKVFKNLMSIPENNLDLGNMIIDRFCEGIPTVTYEGKTYNTIQVGAQCWLKQSLDAGTMILGSATPSNDGIIEKYCYNNELANCATYGAYYQWNEAMQYVTTAGSQGICPAGFHIPTYAEFQTLQTTVNNNDTKLKEIGQGAGNGAGTNTSGFSALISGGRNYLGPFADLGVNMYMWTSSPNIDGGSHFIYLVNNAIGINFSSYDRRSGFSIRCIKN